MNLIFFAGALLKMTMIFMGVKPFFIDSKTEKKPGCIILVRSVERDLQLEKKNKSVESVKRL